MKDTGTRAPGWKSRRARAAPGSVGLNLVVFLISLVVIFLDRLITIVFIVTPRDCDTMQLGFFGGPERLGTVGWLAAIAGALLVFQLFLAWSGWRERSWRWPDAALGLVNLGLISIPLSYALLSWAFFTPTHPLAQTINRGTQIIAPSDFVDPESVWERTFDPRMGWVETGPDEWRNEAFGVLMRHEVVDRCWSEDFVRANYEARYPERQFETPFWIQQEGWVWYDLEGRLIPGQRTRTGSLDPAGRAISPLTFDDIGLNMWIARLEREPDRPTAPDGTPVLTREEIDAIVAEAWDEAEGP